MPRKQYFTILISTFWFLYSFQPLFHDNLSKQLCKFVSRSYDLFRHEYLTTSAMEFTLVEESINPIKKALVGHPHNNWHYYTGEDIYLTGWCLISKNPAPYHQQKTWMLVFKATQKKIKFGKVSSVPVTPTNTTHPVPYPKLLPPRAWASVPFPSIWFYIISAI